MNRIIRCEQGSDEWWAVRAGKPTASEFSSFVTPEKGELSAGKKGGLSQGARTYLYQLLSERIRGGPPPEIESYTSRTMQEGIDCEPEARAQYELLTGVDVEEVGFYLSECGRYGCSPDGRIGGDGGLELKCPLLKTHIGYLREGVLPKDHKLQVHGSLAATGRAWWDFVSYHPSAPMFRLRVEADGFTAKVAEAAAAFCDELDAAWEWWRSIQPEPEFAPEAEVPF